MSIPVIPQVMKHFFNGSQAEMIYLKQEAGSSRMYTTDDLANSIQEITALSASDVSHVLKILLSEIRKVLVRGDRVKLDNLGIMFMTLSCTGVKTMDECNVRNIRKVNIRFRPDKALKLVNNALAETRSDNNVSFAMKSVAATSGTNPTNPGDDGDDDEYIDPNA